MGRYVRLRIQETPAFQKAIEQQERVRMPMMSVLRDHPKALVLGTMMSVATFVLFYLMTVFTLSWGTNALGYPRQQFLMIQLFGILFFAATIPWSAKLADRHGRRRTLLWVSAAIAAFGLVLAPLFGSGVPGMTLTLVIGLALMGLTYAPPGTILSAPFPPAVRYTGAPLPFHPPRIPAATMPWSAKLADRHGRRRTLRWGSAAIAAFGLVLAPLFGSGVPGMTLTLVIGLALMGLTYGPLGTILSELFPTAVRYTGASLTFNLAGIVGASLAPYIATYLARQDRKRTRLNSSH